MKKKNTNGKDHPTKEDLLNDENNPGLDADHSSSGSASYSALNDDNDKISVNNDQKQNTEAHEDYTSLEGK
ncbi:hypothetical protein [Pedobacter frigoris]|uniref:Uncharacterized protein n=1 Tax=Pedobacter frigoris TaxID=2571272 RepID=A0A4U1CPA0_9SPHI|nr:hypothetical protein [Pedobacter frigoris]TKC09313.1 hypothetical protein FA047_04260 [Pedobacter frigoris]